MNKKDRVAYIMEECDKALKWLDKSKGHINEINVNIDKFKEKKKILDYTRDSIVLNEGIGGGNREITETYIDRAKEILDWRDQLRLNSVDISQYTDNIVKGVEAVGNRYMEAYNYAFRNLTCTKKSALDLVDHMSKITLMMREIKQDPSPSMDKLLRLNEKSKLMLETELQIQKIKGELPISTLDYD